MKTNIIDIESEREAFESWYELDAYPMEHSNWFKKDYDGDYELDFVAFAWNGWKGCAENKFWDKRADELITIFEGIENHNEQKS